MRYEYKSDALCLTPGEYLRYHRIFQGLSTRELAERVGIVPATLKQYEWRNAPIKYETALALAEVLNIDYHYLLNSYTAFIDYPFDKLLKEIRVKLHFTQTQFADEIGIAQGTYANWERGQRMPRRQEYYKIIAAAKKLGITI